MKETYSRLFLVLTGLLLNMGAKLLYHILKLGVQETSVKCETMNRVKHFNMKLRTFSPLQTVTVMQWLKSNERVKCIPRYLIIKTLSRGEPLIF